MANVLTAAKRAAIVSTLSEGCSIGTTALRAGVSRNTVMKLLFDLAGACAAYRCRTFRYLACARVRAIELRTFADAKAHVRPSKDGQVDVGEIRTWVALCVESNLAISWCSGPRDSELAEDLLREVAGRLASREPVETVGPCFPRSQGTYPRKVERLAAALELHFMLHNFCRLLDLRKREPEIRLTPAMAAGVADRLWTIPDVVALLNPKA